ncbi:YciK family oxidoreductase [Candidatus Thioglobus sp. NP1]|jgi:NAD(P)-dependent dehydrogenase (short-subunit alcohol dehydrogenase family)|uniref:YciK family oxidoreductase n=1 Tax=Candidatus Thioglobus sp. NP1 TaxID=2508687 RepID=UPI000DEDD064|nr:YciK family oxidoreductase [Candidatus Thioglobus sp. NP1]AXE62273.1 YciK family oxidoreductase [Candidatus Thioglobus sp. NP1]|tara:strand:+ start:3548 stop:4294 length:747 start_codon:yes stop_codon:yes gene_type:complete
MKLPKNYKVKQNELNSKVILVTGANKGFGLAISMDLAKAGATVIMLGRDLSSLEYAYDAVVDAGYKEPILYPLDLEGASPENYQELQDNIIEKFNRLDGLIHNAAILGTQMPIDQYDIKLWYSTLQINLSAPFMLTQFLIPALKKSDDARILFLSSSVGRKARAYWGAYSVSKFGLEGLAMTLSEELEKTKIKVNTINPGKMRTEMRRTAYPAEDASTLPKPEEKSSVIVYLLSKEAERINGEQLSID